MPHKFGKATPKQIVLYSLLIVAALALVVLYMAGGNDVFDGGDKEPAYTYEQAVTLPMHTVRTLNPAASTDEDTRYIAPLIYGSLFRLGPDMSPQADLAASYKFDRSTSSITVTIRDDAVWEDGEPVRGYDVVFAVEVYKLAGDGCNYKDKIDHIGYVQADGKAVTVYFNDDTDMGLDLLTFPVLPSHKYDYYGEAMSTSSDFKPLGCGQYKVQSYDPGGFLTLVPSETYYGTPAANTVTFDTEGKKGDLYQRLQAGGVSLMISADPDRSTYITKKDISVTDFPANTVEFMGFNCKGSAFNNRAVRQAVCYAVDCDSIIERQYYGSGVKNDGLFFPGYMGIDSSELTYPFDIKVAEEKLAQAGYAGTDEDGNVINANGETLKVTILVNKKDAAKAGTAEIVADSLEEMGIIVEVNELDETAYYAALKAGEYDIYFGTYTFDDRMDMRLLYGYESTNYAGYDNDALVALLDQLRGGSNLEEMADLVSKIRTTTITDVPYLCLLYRTYGAIGSSTFDGTPTPLWNDPYYNCSEWQSKYLVKEDEEDGIENPAGGEGADEDGE